MQTQIWERARQLSFKLSDVSPATSLLGLVRAIEVGTSEELRIALIGSFNTGKSTLINRLLGQPLLPTDDLTETGTAVWVRRGRGQTATAIDSSGHHRPVDLTPIGLGDATSLLDNGGFRRQASQIAERVEIVLEDAPLPDSVVLIDSPGLNDDAGMDERALAIAASADQVIFLLRSDQFLAESEIAFLQILLSQRDPRSVHLVLNCFMQELSPESWQTFLANTLPVHQQRLAQRGCEIGLDDDNMRKVTVVSAIADADGDDFGLAALRERLEEIARTGLRTQGIQQEAQLATHLREVRTAITTRIVSLRHSLVEAFKVIERNDEARRSSEVFKREVAVLVVAAHARFAKELQDFAHTAAASITPGNLKRDDSYRVALQAVVARACGEQAARLVDEAARIARRSRRIDADTGRAVRLVATHFRAVVPAIVVPNANASGGVIAAGAAARLVLGTWVPVIGWGVGPAIGAIIAAVSRTKAVQRDIEGLKANIATAVTAAVEDLRGRLSEIAAAVIQTFPASPMTESNPRFHADLANNIQELKRHELIDESFENILDNLARRQRNAMEAT